MEIVKFWKEVPSVDPGGQGIGFSWAIAVETRARAWRSENGRIVSEGVRGLVVMQRERVIDGGCKLVVYLWRAHRMVSRPMMAATTLCVAGQWGFPVSSSVEP